MTGRDTATGLPAHFFVKKTSDRLYRGIVSSISSIVYGTAVADKSSDELLGQIFEVMHAIAHFAAKKRHMVEIFPSMLLLPDWLAKWKRDAVAFSQKYTAIFGGYYESVGLRLVRHL